ncbi:MAG: adenosylcobinamide-GDP ribazoletransferase [Leptospira sp.]|nr:adenosylcobinamide-GDP ribazoletransferase [Leptospira sp.]
MMDFFKKEVLYFFSALMFFTRIPCPKWVSGNYSQDILNRSRKYFPLMGWIVAGLSLLVFFIAIKIFSLELSILLTMVTSILITGGFHEDGWADSCDAFGGGWTKESILSIMKDSRIGTYGTLGVVFILGIKFTCLRDLGREDLTLMATTYFFAHTVSRFLASSAAQNLDYVQFDDSSKSKPIAESKLSHLELIYSFIFVVIPMLFLMNQYLVLAFLLAWIMQIIMILYFKKWIGGFTGDCLGGIQQVSEIAIYLGTIAIWKFIPIYGKVTPIQ